MLLRYKTHLKMKHLVYTLIILSTFTLVTSKHLPKLAQYKQIFGKHPNKMIVCTTTVMPDPDRYRFEIEKTDLNLCTHLICIDNIWDETITFWSSSDLKKEKIYERLTNLRQKYPHLKVSLALKYYLSAYMGIAENEDHRRGFAEKATEFVSRHKFDGLDLVWDFTEPREDQGVLNKTALLNLVKDLKVSFKKYNLTLSSSFIAENSRFAAVIDLTTMSKHLNYVHFIPKYDYIETWPGSYRIDDVLKERGISKLEDSIDNLIKLGVSTSKIVVGVHFTGLSFHSLFDVSSKFATFRKSLDYNEICQVLLNNKNVEWEKYYDEESGMAIAKREAKPYGVLRPTDVIVYENSRSIANKMLFILSRNVAGVMAFPIDMDDFHGNCGIEEDTFVDFDRGHDLHISKRYNIIQPLLKTINFAIHIATTEEIQARLTNKFQRNRASDRMDTDFSDDNTSKLPAKYRALESFLHILNDAIVVGIDRFTGFMARKWNDEKPQTTQVTSSLTAFVAGLNVFRYVADLLSGFY